MSSSIDSSPPIDESSSGSPSLSEGGSLETHRDQSMTSKGAKYEHDVTKDLTDCSSCTPNVMDKNDETYKCSALDCKRSQGFASLAILRRHETEIHRMHNASQKLQCPIPTCKRHNGNGFQRNKQLENHIRRKHPNDSNNLERCLKRGANVDLDKNFQDIKRLKEDTIHLRNQFAAGAVCLAEMTLLIRQLQGNAGMPRKTSMFDKNGCMTEQRAEQDDSTGTA